MKLLYKVILWLIPGLLFSGCFTGVESTPKITADDVKRENVVVTAEQQFLSDIKPESFDLWKPGKEFYVTDDKISLIFDAYTQGKKGLKDSVLTYKGSRQVMSVTGRNSTELVFAATDGHECVYRIDVPVEELSERETVDVPFTIELSVVHGVRELLHGRELYVITPVWYDDGGAVVTGKKYVPVTITDVSAGNNVYPVKLTFKEKGGKLYSLFMSAGRNVNVSRPFHKLFAFEDPHKKYPEITDEIWANIINGRVAVDMTRDECRLSLGVPKSVDRRPGYGGVQEVWVYDDGKCLVFEDGLLRNYRR